MTREDERDMACTNWICNQKNGTVIKAREVWKAAVKWADQHPTPNWISVEERLPEVGEKVIFYSPGIDDWLSGAFQQDGTWWNEEYGTHFYGVTHWMEIVPPRKEEDNE